MAGALQLLDHGEVEPRLDHAAVEAARLVRASRDRLLTEAGAVTLGMLAKGRGSTLNAARQWVYRQRKAGRLVTVEHGGEALVPVYQLNNAFDVEPLVGDVIERLVAAGMSPWAVWRWFYAHNGWIDERPVDAVERGDADTLDHAARHLLDAA